MNVCIIENDVVVIIKHQKEKNELRLVIKNKKY